jgi:hypothetical protein
VLVEVSGGEGDSNQQGAGRIEARSVSHEVSTSFVSAVGISVRAGERVVVNL